MITIRRVSRPSKCWPRLDGDEHDVLDVPHTLEGSGQQNGSEYHFQATASVNAMVNENSSGFKAILR